VAHCPPPPSYGVNVMGGGSDNCGMFDIFFIQYCEYRNFLPHGVFQYECKVASPKTVCIRLDVLMPNTCRFLSHATSFIVKN